MATNSPEGKIELGVTDGVEDDTGYWTLALEKAHLASKHEVKLLQNRQQVVMDQLFSLRSNSFPFSEQSATNFLSLHQRLQYLASHPLSPLQLPEFHRFDSAYWDIPFEPNGAKVFTAHLSPHLEVWSGKLSSFDHGLRALVVDMAMRVYASELIQTEQLAHSLLEAEGISETAPDYPRLHQRKKAELEAQLLLAMSHSFRPNYALAVAFAKPNGPQGARHLVGSIGAMQGSTERTLQETVGWDGSQMTSDQVEILSSLPTNMALTYILNAAGANAAQIPEHTIAEITRLNVAPRQVCEQLGVRERGKLSQTLMYIIHHAVQEHMPGVEWELLNTQEPLHRVIRQLGLPAEQIAQRDSIQPTALIANSIHGHYFQRTPPIPQLMRVEDAVKASGEHLYRR